MKYLLILFLTFNVVAQEPVSFESLLGNLKALEAKDFDKKIVTVKKDFDRFFENRSRICQGDFSTMVLGEEEVKEEEDKNPVKLSRKEIKACLNNLVNERMVYIDALYELRGKYLKFLHSEQLKQLDASKEKEIAKWQKLKTTK